MPDRSGALQRSKARPCSNSNNPGAAHKPLPPSTSVASIEPTSSASYAAMEWVCRVSSLSQSTHRPLGFELRPSRITLANALVLLMPRITGAPLTDALCLFRFTARAESCHFPGPRWYHHRGQRISSGTGGSLSPSGLGGCTEKTARLGLRPLHC